MPTNDAERIRRLLIGRLESLQRAGVRQLPKRRGLSAAIVVRNVAARAIPANEARESSADEPAPEAASPPPASASSPVANKPTSRWRASGVGTLFGGEESATSAVPAAGTLEVLQQQVAGCTRCDELARTRTQTVFGVGNPNARLCFLGEAPGADEDRLGEPFVGRGGQLLNKIIEACRLKREEVYILNMIKCRPPGNRNPLPEELANCRGYLEGQLALIRPEFICCLGAVAAQNLLGTTLSIGKVRGKVHDCRGAKVVCTYHPAYLLRNPAAKKDTWEDMKLLMREMGVNLLGAR